MMPTVLEFVMREDEINEEKIFERICVALE